MCALRWAHSLHWQLREPEIISAGWSMEKVHSESQANCNQILHGQKSLCWASCGPWMILVKRMTFQKQQGAQHCSSPWCAFVALLQLTNSENYTCFKTESELSMIPALGSLSFLEIASRACWALWRAALPSKGCLLALTLHKAWQCSTAKLEVPAHQ